MISADGLSREQFIVLWRDAMWSSVSVSERTRLVLELGRIDVREKRGAAPLIVAYVEGLNSPFVLLQVLEAPTVDRPSVRNALRLQLAEIGASEVYVLITMRGGKFGGVDNFLLSAWGESLEDEVGCWVMPFRWTRVLQEAAPIPPPKPRDTEIAKNLAGLLTLRH